MEISQIYFGNRQIVDKFSSGNGKTAVCRLLGAHTAVLKSRLFFLRNIDAETFIFRGGVGNQVSAVHKRGTGIFLAVRQIYFIRAQTLEAHAASGRVGLYLQVYDAQQGLAFIWAYKFPSVADGEFFWICETVVTSVLDQVIIFLKFFDLLLNYRYFVFFDVIGIQFIAEGSGHGHRGPGLQRRDPAGLVVGAVGHMGTHCADGISKGCAILDGQTVDGVCVVAAPDLRRVVQHSRVEPAAAAAAPLNEKVGIVLAKSINNLL